MNYKLSKIIYCSLILLILLYTRLSAQPAILWAKTFRDSCDYMGNCVQITADGGYIMVGTKGCYNKWGEILLIKTDAFGDILWSKTYNDTNRGGWIDPFFGQSYGNCVQQTSDGGYIVTGQTQIKYESFWTGWARYSSIGVIKTDASGDTLWLKSYTNGSYNVGKSVLETNDGGYILYGNAGHYSSTISWQHLWLIKINSAGKILWTKTYDSSNWDWDWGSSIKQTTDNGYILVGTVYYDNADADIWLLKTDSSGDTLWTRKFGINLWDKGISGQQTSDGGYVILGNTQSPTTDYDILLIKTDASGNIRWTKTYGGAGYDEGNALQQTSDGGYIITGQTRPLDSVEGDLWLIRTSELGDTLWTKTFGGGDGDNGQSVKETSDGGYIIAGYMGMVEGTGMGKSAWLIKTTIDPLNSVKDHTRSIYIYLLSQNYPNPFNPSTTIEFTLPKSEFVELKVYNILGKEISTLVSKKLNQGKHTYTFDGRNLASGVYYYRIKAGNFVQTRKMVYLK